MTPLHLLRAIVCLGWLLGWLCVGWIPVTASPPQTEMVPGPEEAIRRLAVLALEGDQEAAEQLSKTLSRLDLPELEKYGDLGIREAAYLLGEHYRTELSEDGTAPDRAIEWYRRAAIEQHVDAQYQLGQLLVFNDDDRDDEEATHWLEQAAALEHRLARGLLGLQYWWGSGAPQDRDEAVRLWCPVLRGGHELVEQWMARAFVAGDGVRLDLELAEHWYRRAIAHGNLEAYQELAHLLAVERGELGAALDLWLTAAEAGSADAQLNLAIAYAQGRGIDQDLDQSFRWLLLAHQHDHDWAEAWLDELAQDVDEASIAAARAWVDDFTIVELPPAESTVSLTFLSKKELRPCDPHTVHLETASTSEAP